MKKSFGYFVSLGIGLGMLSAAGAAQVEITDTSVTKINGAASIERGGKIVPVTPGMPLRSGDAVRTENGAELDFAMNALAGCRLLEGTEIRVAETHQDGMRLELKSGNVVLNLEKLPDKANFTVQTPTAVASVRGTQFWGRVYSPQNPDTTFAVRQGSIEISRVGTDEIYTIKKDQALDIPGDLKTAAAPRESLAAERQALEQADTIKTCA